MVSGVPECIAISAWLGQWRTGSLSATDVANAIETITGQIDCDGATWLEVVAELTRDAPFAPAMPQPGDPCGVPDRAALGAVALRADMLLVRRADGWHLLRTAHTVPTRLIADAQRDLTEVAHRAQHELDKLATVGSRAQTDAALAALPVPPLPPSLPDRCRRALQTAVRMMVLVDCALADSAVPSSPSQEAHRVRLLLDVKQSARGLLMASVTH